MTNLVGTHLRRGYCNRERASSGANVTLVQMHGAHDAIVVLVFTVVGTFIAAGIVRWGRLGSGAGQLTAGLRACAQLAIVGAIVGAVLQSWALSLLFCVLMLSVAAYTSAHRILGRATWWTLAPICGGVLPGVLGMLATGLVPIKPIAVIPVLGIVGGNSMTATSLSGKRIHESLRTRYGEFEAGLSIGLTRAEAADVVARDDAALALIPGMDQTRTVGLVTLPGAFVGALLGGASAWEAAAVQLLVLVALLVAQAVAVLITTELTIHGHLGGIGAPHDRPARKSTRESGRRSGSDQRVGSVSRSSSGSVP
ncbi:ABC transporter permease [Flexivirga endophytica]|uniref:ABC transporter permease n=1 Tax=Flexivirga endophytica TaxID=1849103 RepID=UPI001E3DE6F7|nr:ABC transporter permease [Flexivirga endophytica]